MKYVIADIHGCFAEFQELLEKLCFSSQDESYLLGDIHGYIPEKPLDTYAFEDFLFYRADYRRIYYKKQDTYLVTGHTPTMLLRSDSQSLLYEQNGHIALDCGCVYGGKLAAYCLDTQEVFYVNAKQIYYP